MPLYTYSNPETGERIDVIQGMNDIHAHVGPDGKEWKRVFYSPNAAIDSLSSIDPFDTKKLAAKTGQKKGTVGDLWNVSKEASERRADKVGAEDPIRRKHLDNYAKENKVKHWEDRPKKIENKHAVIDFTAKSE